MELEQFLTNNAWIISLIALIVIPIKGFALWTSARKSQKWWFIAILVINSLAIVELIYLFAIAKVHKNWKKTGETKSAPETPKTPAL